MTEFSVYLFSRNFFEMVRFDFIVDENMKVWLMEVWSWSRALPGDAGKFDTNCYS